MLPTSSRSAYCGKPLAYAYELPRLGTGSNLLTAAGAFLTGMVSVGIGEVAISQLTRTGLPIAVAAAASVLIVQYCRNYQNFSGRRTRTSLSNSIIA